MEEILDEIKKYFKGELRTINQNLKAVSRLIKIQRFFTILAFSLIIWISISSVISMISQNPSKKKDILIFTRRKRNSKNCGL